MRDFNYALIRERKWDPELLGLVAAIYKEAGKQEMYLKQRPVELEKLVEIARIQSADASNAIEGIVTTNTRIRQLVEKKTAPKNRDEQEIAGYRDVLGIIHENYDAIQITQNYILQLHKILYSHMNNLVAGKTKTVQNYISATYPDGHTETLFWQRRMSWRCFFVNRRKVGTVPFGFLAFCQHFANIRSERVFTHRIFRYKIFSIISKSVIYYLYIMRTFSHIHNIGRFS